MSALLPERTAEAEEAFLHRFRQGEQDGLDEAVAAALESRRPQLAARLVGLLDHDDSPELERARRAAAFVLHKGLTAEDASWCVLDDAWREVVRDRRMGRARSRWQRAAKGTERGHTRSPRVGSRNRRK